MRQFAVRNLRLCTKDCMCLYVCPVGATDTEDSVIDVGKCIGCGIGCSGTGYSACRYGKSVGGSGSKCGKRDSNDIAGS